MPTSDTIVVFPGTPSPDLARTLDLGGYRWKAGLGYYESTKDASTNFFFHFIPMGTHVFEYPMFVSHNGRFSAGIASVECMYAPEFRAHSEGSILRVR